MTSGGNSPTSDVATKLDKYWKGVAAVVGMLGLVSAAASWGFSYAMSSRDRQAEELRRDLEKMSADVQDMSAEQRHMSDKFRDDMHDVEIALTAIQTHLRVEERMRPDRLVAKRRPMPARPNSSQVQAAAADAGANASRQIAEDLSGIETLLNNREESYAARYNFFAPVQEQSMERLEDAIQRLENRREIPASLADPLLGSDPTVLPQDQSLPAVPPPASPTL